MAEEDDGCDDDGGEEKNEDDADDGDGGDDDDDDDDDDLREFALCYSRHPGDMRGRSRVRAALWERDPGAPTHADGRLPESLRTVGESLEKGPHVGARALSQTPPPSRFKPG